MIFWDTSCVLKLYVAEPDSDQWERHAVTLEDDFACSALLEAELACALQRKERDEEIIAGAAEALMSAFHADLRAGRFSLCPVGSDVVAQAATIAAACYRHPQPVYLHTLDALHLATAQLMKCRKIVTADERMRAAAALLNLAIV